MGIVRKNEELVGAVRMDERLYELEGVLPVHIVVTRSGHQEERCAEVSGLADI